MPAKLIKRSVLWIQLSFDDTPMLFARYGSLFLIGEAFPVSRSHGQTSRRRLVGGACEIVLSFVTAQFPRFRFAELTSTVRAVLWFLPRFIERTFWTQSWTHCQHSSHRSLCCTHSSDWRRGSESDGNRYFDYSVTTSPPPEAPCLITNERQ